MKLSLIASASALALSACAWTPPGAEQASVLRTAPVFRYAIEGPVTIGVVQAFNKDGQTYVQFLDIARANPAISGPSGEALGFATTGQYAVLAGVQDDLTVTTPYGRVRVYARVTPPAGRPESPRPRAPAVVPSVNPEPVTSSAGTADLLATARAELARAEARIAELQSQLREIRGSSPADRQARADLGQHIGQLRAAIDKTNDSMVRVSFDFGASDFAIAPSLAATLVPAAKAAAQVTVRGYTDSPVADAANRRVALARAVSARRYLVAQGVDAKKIRAYYSSSGSFIADNSTAEGRAQNRRVEIQLQPAASSAVALTASAGMS